MDVSIIISRQMATDDYNDVVVVRMRTCRHCLVISCNGLPGVSLGLLSYLKLTRRNWTAPLSLSRIIIIHGQL